MSSIKETTNESEHSESQVPVQSSFVDPANDIDIDFEREIEYYSTVTHVTNERVYSESETEEPPFYGQEYYPTYSPDPEFIGEQWKGKYQLVLTKVCVLFIFLATIIVF